MKDLVLDFLEVTEKAAIAAAYWIGRGNKNEADGAATTAMREQLNKMAMSGTVVIGEGELDEAPMLYIGERLGIGGFELDIAVDPVEGTSLIANGLSNSIAVIAAAPKGTLLHAPDMYMEKIAVGPKAAGKVDIEAPLLDNLKAVAEAQEKKLSQLTVMIQNRERHAEMIEQIREAGAKVKLFEEGDVTYNIAPGFEKSGVDLFIGIGGAPEGVISAVGIKCLGGEMQARLLPANKAEFNRCIQMGISQPNAPMKLNQLISSNECIFAATGITESTFINGVSESGSQLVTHSIVMYGIGKKVQFVKSLHPALMCLTP